MVGNGRAWSMCRAQDSSRLDEPLHPVPMPGEGGEQFAHLLVRPITAAREGVDDMVREVEVAERDGVGITEGALSSLCHRPLADARDREQSTAGLRRWQGGALLDASR